MRKRNLLAVGATGALGALAAYNRRLKASGESSETSLGERRYYRWMSNRPNFPGGELAYSVAGSGPPLLLVHGIYAGASSFEFRKNFEALSERFTVYAPDLLGCGASQKPRRPYAPEDVAAQIEGFARDVVSGRAHLLASSLSGALALPALVRNPRLFGKVALICPTGYRTLDRPSGTLGDLVYGLFRAPVVGDSLYHALVSRPSLRLYLTRTAYHNPTFVTRDLIEDYHRAAHGRGAKYLPAAFASGKLNFDVSDYWPRVANRTIILWGQEAKEAAPVELLNTFLENNPRATYRIFRDAALLPHDERADAFNRELAEFFSN